MKKIIKYISLAVILLTTASCNDFLTVTPQDSLTTDNYYNSESKIRANTATLYGSVWWDFHSQFMWLAGDQMAGDLYYTYDQEGQFFFFSYNNGNAYITRGWKGLFRVVSYANSVINDMPPAATNVSQEVIDRAVAEGRFVRAVAYYYLTEYWGEVPIIENSTEKIVSGNLFVPKNTRKSCYEFMIRDLEYAANTLPDKDAQLGRATKWAAKAMLAKVHLTYAASAVGNSAVYGDATAHFTKAKELCTEIIENSGRTLDADFQNLFTVEGNNVSESLFAIQCQTGTYGGGNSRNTNFSRSSVIADQTWGAGKGPTIDLQKAFDQQKDVRRRWTYMKQNDKYPMLNKVNGGYTYNNFVEADNENPNEVLAHIKKYVIGKASDTDNKVGLNQDAANNIHIIRLADVYLMYGEAVLGASASTSDAKALEYFNAVHSDRAGLTEATSLTFESILKERRLEFAFEALRWLDIKRYYYRNPSAALALLNSQKRELIYVLKDGYSSAEDKNNNNNYEEFEPAAGFVRVYDSQMFLPIPAEALTGNPRFKEDAVDYTFND
ncbi:RagB/SusD family nutrient uptake outer membrane protein [Dysgonomonas sp. HDW5B]|uniref:RagB/SusD family nutrient uptake outer membrane protein n=1 Tax=Dysgonomonas sp. HDW5B TaxID=2714927 RepID=UPI00140B2779|nr:RagB/SusD family nutrient uptake outer membrane protein [Dysgonomonas sp. HDW5B]QIK53337.1 RagB/SusD family nutrient uptake outer membrane protein [Dysgonomonas sp. HDW5B]